MESWIATSLILCTFGFLKELRPSEPFVTDYIIEYKNITVEEVIHVAFPVSTYTSLASLAIILLVTDLLRYKPVVILEAVCHVLAWGILTLSTGLTAVIIVEVFYGIAASAELAYSTYIYAQVDRDYYKRVTSQTHSARLAGKFFGGLIAQLLITWNLMTYHQLNYVTVACVSVGMLCTLFLPSVKTNKQYYLRYSKITAISGESEPLKQLGENSVARASSRIRHTCSEIVTDLKSAYGNIYILKWSLWWAIASAGQYQVINYVQALWEKVREDGGNEDELYNGAVKAGHTFLSALLSFGFQFTNIRWETWGEVTLTCISVVQGLMLIWMAKTNSLWIAYFSYLIFRTIHPVMITVASVEIAQNIRKESHGLIFGLNMFIALILQTVLTIVVSDMKGLALDERSQYFLYGICFAILGLLIGGSSIFSLVKKRFVIAPIDNQNEGSCQDEINSQGGEVEDSLPFSGVCGKANDTNAVESSNENNKTDEADVQRRLKNDETV